MLVRLLMLIWYMKTINHFTSLLRYLISFSVGVYVKLYIKSEVGTGVLQSSSRQQQIFLSEDFEILFISCPTKHPS